MKAYKPISILVVLVSLVVATFAFGATLFAAARQSQPAPLPQGDTDKWQTYSDERFNFKLQYPSGWYLSVIPADVAGGGVQISNYDLHDEFRDQKGIPSDYFKIEVIVIGGDPRMPGQSLEEWRRARADYDATKVRQESLTTLKDYETLEEKVEYYPGIEITTIYFPYSDKIYGETVLFVSATPFREPIFEEIFRRIVSSLEFEK